MTDASRSRHHGQGLINIGTQDNDRASAWQADELRWSQWMAQAHAGDRAAYENLLTELGRVLDTYIRVRFGPIDGIEDCIQECLLTVHKARHTYDPGRAFRPWFFTLVRHRTIDFLRQGRGDRGHRGTDAVRELASDPNELHRRLDGVKVLENLAPAYREAVALTQYAGCTAAEAADWLGISESALKARLRRGLSAIRKTLEAEGLPL